MVVVVGRLVPDRLKCGVCPQPSHASGLEEIWSCILEFVQVCDEYHAWEPSDVVGNGLEDAVPLVDVPRVHIKDGEQDAVLEELSLLEEIGRNLQYNIIIYLLIN